MYELPYNTDLPAITAAPNGLAANEQPLPFLGPTYPTGAQRAEGLHVPPPDIPRPTPATAGVPLAPETVRLDDDTVPDDKAGAPDKAGWTDDSDLPSEAEVAEEAKAEDGPMPAKDEPDPSVVERAELAEPDAKQGLVERPKQSSPYYEVDEDGTCRPCDIGDPEHAPLRANEVPKSLLKDPNLANGRQFWQEHGHEVPFTLVLVDHGSSQTLRESLDGLRDVAMALKESGGVVYVETVDTEDAIQDLEAKFTEVSNASLDDLEAVQASLHAEAADRTSQMGSRAEIALRLAGTGVDVAFPDYREGNYGRAVDFALEELDIISQFTASLARTPEALAQADVLRFADTLYRNGYLVCSIGDDLAERYERTGVPPGGAALVVGAFHETIEDILTEMGVRVTPMRIDSLDNDMTRLFAKCLRKGSVSPRESVALAFFTVAWLKGR